MGMCTMSPPPPPPRPWATDRLLAEKISNRVSLEHNKLPGNLNTFGGRLISSLAPCGAFATPEPRWTSTVSVRPWLELESDTMMECFIL